MKRHPLWALLWGWVFAIVVGVGGAALFGNILPAPRAKAQSFNVTALTPVVSSAAESNHVLKASSGFLYSLYITTGASAGFLMTFNATSAPVDGAVTPVDCIQVPANTTVALTVNSGPSDNYSTGITAVFSTTGCFTKTASATAFFKGRVY